MEKYYALPFLLRRVVMLLALVVLSPILIALMIAMLVLALVQIYVSRSAKTVPAAFVYGAYMLIVLPILASGGRNVSTSEQGIRIPGLFSTNTVAWSDISRVRRYFDAPGFGLELLVSSGASVKIGFFDISESLEQSLRERGIPIKGE